MYLYHKFPHSTKSPPLKVFAGSTLPPVNHPITTSKRPIYGQRSHNAPKFWCATAIIRGSPNKGRPLVSLYPWRNTIIWCAMLNVATLANTHRCNTGKAGACNAPKCGVTRARHMRVGNQLSLYREDQRKPSSCTGERLLGGAKVINKHGY
jgi:hypothetical protein